MRTPLLLLFATASLLAFGACGDDDDDGAASGGAGGGMTKLTVGILPLTDYAPLYIGMERGYFEDEGLEVETLIAQSGPAIVPSLVSGEAQIGGVSAVTALQAKSRGLPINVIAGANEAGERGGGALIVAKGSELDDPGDLNGKRVAVNALKALGEFGTRVAVDKNGGDASTLKFLPMPYPEMGQALEAGRVDAIDLGEPFILEAENQGHKTINYPATEIGGASTVISVWIANSQFAEENPEVIESFNRALARTTEELQSNSDAVREIIPTYTRIEPDVAAKIDLPTYVTELNRDSLEQQAELLLRYDFVEEAPNVDDLVFTP